MRFISLKLYIAIYDLLNVISTLMPSFLLDMKLNASD